MKSWRHSTQWVFHISSQGQTQSLSSIKASAHYKAQDEQPALLPWWWLWKRNYIVGLRKTALMKEQLEMESELAASTAQFSFLESSDVGSIPPPLMEWIHVTIRSIITPACRCGHGSPVGRPVDSVGRAGGTQVFGGGRGCGRDSTSEEPPWWSPAGQMDWGLLSLLRHRTGTRSWLLADVMWHQGKETVMVREENTVS